MKSAAVRRGGKADRAHCYRRAAAKKTPIKEPNESSTSEYNYHKADSFQKS